MIVVVPPMAAARVPEAKSSETRSSPTGSCIWVCASMPPGMTSLPLASCTTSAGPGSSSTPIPVTRLASPVRRSATRSPAASISVPPRISTSRCPFSLPWASCPEPPSPLRKLGMGLADVDADEVPVDHHLLARHEQMAHPPIGTQHESVNRVGKVCEVVGGPYGDVGG